MNVIMAYDSNDDGLLNEMDNVDAVHIQLLM
jgi:hypothetical protein